MLYDKEVLYGIIRRRLFDKRDSFVQAAVHVYANEDTGKQETILNTRFHKYLYDIAHDLVEDIEEDIEKYIDEEDNKPS